MKLVLRNTITVDVKEDPVVEPLFDEEGFETGEFKTIYSKRELLVDSTGEPLKVNVSASKGEAQANMFGVLASYDKVMLTDWIDCPIDETYIVYVENKAYRVKKVAKSLNYISYALSGIEDEED